MKRIAALPVSLAALPAFAHEGHGAASQWHWHATDLWGFVAVAALAALAYWLSKGE